MRIFIGFILGFIVAVMLSYYGILNVNGTGRMIEKGGSKAIKSVVSYNYNGDKRF